MQRMQNFYQPRTQPFLNGLSWTYITGHNSAVSQPFEVKFFSDFLHEEDIIFWDFLRFQNVCFQKIIFWKNKLFSFSEVLQCIFSENNNALFDISEEIHSKFSEKYFTFFKNQIVQMVKIAVMVSSYAELQFDISEEINFKFQKNISLFSKLK